LNQETLQTLEYDKIKAWLREYAMNHLGQAHIDRLEPKTELRVIERLLAEAEEAVRIIELGASVPISALEGIEAVMRGMGKGILMTEKDLTAVAVFLSSCGQLVRFMSKRESIAPTVSLYARSIDELEPLRNEIDLCIRYERVTDQASAELAKIRKKLAVVEDRMRKKLDELLSKYRTYLQEAIVSQRGGHYVLAVKKEHRKSVRGSVLDVSSSGQSVFIEPDDVAGLQQERDLLQALEAAEEAKVLSRLTGLVEERERELRLNLETIGAYDFLFAKAKLALALDGRRPKLGHDGMIRITEGRHPLLGKTMIPLQLAIGESYSALVITGPNKGGKTVALKTTGLLTLMVQSGLLVPCSPESRFTVCTDVLADIGDGQSLEQSLSTFSAHIKALKTILERADRQTLVLLDELAAGTDPGEGIGLSIAVLEELYQRGATVLATTHFHEIKRFAERTPGFEVARMEFDLETLAPLYRLTIGQAGESCALYIAAKLGIPEAIISRSRAHVEATAAEVSWSRADSAEDPVSQPAPATDNRSASQQPAPARNQKRNEPKSNSAAPKAPFRVGDCVFIPFLKKKGIVYRPEDERGEVIVQVQKQKMRIKAKRLSLYIPKEKLYPDHESYDLDIVLESKETRRLRSIMKRKHVDSLTLELPEDPVQ
jgi:dsDNA-specific endonuclease/ATPase MutS2